MSIVIDNKDDKFSNFFQILKYYSSFTSYRSNFWRIHIGLIKDSIFVLNKFHKISSSKVI